ncbi:MAG: hypothetical protein IPL84_17770 [Chitinophagaceae bacterium]|nr:hypothetical protein [Chitinophagaceae bacterium]
MQVIFHKLLQGIHSPGNDGKISTASPCLGVTLSIFGIAATGAPLIVGGRGGFTNGGTEPFGLVFILLITSWGFNASMVSVFTWLATIIIRLTNFF